MDQVDPESSDNDEGSRPNPAPGRIKQQYRCAVCSRAFARRDKLERHSRVHSGEKPFLCFECGRAFARRDKLIRHRKEVHTGERPFRCELCARTFARRDTLKTHKRIHTDRDVARNRGAEHQLSSWVSLLDTQTNGLKRDK